jgi:hypothetical protein
MRLIRTTSLIVLGSLVLLGGCASDPTGIPDPYGIDGYLERGWAAYEDGDYAQALEYFQAAIDLDVTGVESYVGAGWASIFIEDYWRVADDYFFMAIQNDAGGYPLAGLTETQVQDTMWTHFVCLHPDLPPDVLEPILEMTADSGAIWVGSQINAIIGNAPIQYRFETVYGSAMAMFEIENGTSLTSVDIDSIVDGWAFVTVPRRTIIAQTDTLRNWINVDNAITYDYRTFDPTGGESQYTLDALAGSVVLQDVRAANGDPLLGTASALALDALTGDYSFGHGKQYEGLETLNNIRMVGNGAAIGFSEEAFLFTWYMCKTMGYGTDLDPTRDTFGTDLLVVIENMMNS